VKFLPAQPKIKNKIIFPQSQIQDEAQARPVPTDQFDALSSMQASVD
jgi:hypothetical protein